MIHPRHPLLGVIAVMAYIFLTYRSTNNWSGLARRNRRIKLYLIYPKRPAYANTENHHITYLLSTIVNYTQAIREKMRWAVWTGLSGK